VGVSTKANKKIAIAKELKVPFYIKLKNREAIAAYIFLAPFLLLFSIFFVRATITSVRISFFDWRLLRPDVRFIGIQNYVELINDSIWWDAVQNTMFFAVMTVIGATIFGLAAALAVPCSFLCSSAYVSGCYRFGLELAFKHTVWNDKLLSKLYWNCSC